ncbi:MAG: DNA polymerase I, partial [Muribaculaceae bacterium]|nr:DNA polymerase I [Muribaculaceae bacterium]
YALIFRAYYALIKMPRITQAGFNTSAIFGFVNTLEEILRKENPTHIAVCFDPQGPTFRNEAYENYKSEREATPEDIRLSIPIIKEIVKAYNIPVVEVEGFEADDVIGTLARRAEKEGFTTYMMTPDKDYGQLVSPSILQYKPAYRGQDFELRGEEEVCGRYGIERTEQVIDLLALMGDKIDNIPGCPGVGEKTAVKLIQEFGSVENLLDNTSSLKGALKKKVEENAEQIRFSKFLATIRTDVPVDVNPDDLKRKGEDKDKLFAIFKELEFRSLIDRVGRRISSNGAPAAKASQPSLFDEGEIGEMGGIGNIGNIGNAPTTPNMPTMPTSPITTSYSLLSSSAELRSLADEILPLKECGVFLLADGENDATSSWVGTAIATEPGKAYYIPADFKEGCEFVLDLLARKDIMKVSGNTKRDYVVASRRRTDDAPAVENYYDVALAHYILQPEMRHGISDLASQYLNVTPLPLPQPAAGAK